MTEELPEAWALTKLANVVDVLDGQRVPVNSRDRSARTGQVPYYGATGQVGWIDDHLFDEDLVLLGEDGVQFFDPVKPKAYLISGKSWVNNHAHVLRARPDVIDRTLLCHYLNYIDYHGFANGSTRLKLTQAAMNSIPVLLPPLAEQRRIVTALDEQLSRLENADATLQASDSRSRLADSSLLDAAVSGRLAAPSGEPVDELLADVARRRTARKPALPPGHVPGYELPARWGMVSLDALAWDAGYGTSAKCGLEADGVPVLRIPNIKNGTVILHDLKRAADPDINLAELLVEAGDLLFVRTNGSLDLIGRAAVVQKKLGAAFASYLIRYRVIPNGVDPLWIHAVVSSPKWRALIKAGASSSAGQHNVNLATLGSLPIPVPPRREQAAILDMLNNRRRQLDQLTFASRTVRHKSHMLRQSLLAATFNGRLVPQDSNDEPASVLLERIRREQANSRPQGRSSSRTSRAAANRPAPSATHSVPAGIQEELPL